MTREEALAELVMKWRRCANLCVTSGLKDGRAHHRAIVYRENADELEAALALPADAPRVQFQGSQDEQTNAQVIANLAMLVRRLAHKHPNEKLKKQANDYLLGEGLEGSVLRSYTPAAQAAEPENQSLRLATWFARTYLEPKRVPTYSIEEIARHVDAEFAAVQLAGITAIRVQAQQEMRDMGFQHPDDVSRMILETARRASTPTLTAEDVKFALGIWSQDFPCALMASRLNAILAAKSQKGGDSSES